MSYEKYYFKNYSIVEDAVYIIENNKDFINKLEDKGFKIEKLNNWKIAYK